MTLLIRFSDMVRYEVVYGIGLWGLCSRFSFRLHILMSGVRVPPRWSLPDGNHHQLGAELCRLKQHQSPSAHRSAQTFALIVSVVFLILLLSLYPYFPLSLFVSRSIFLLFLHLSLSLVLPNYLSLTFFPLLFFSM